MLLLFYCYFIVGNITKYKESFINTLSKKGTRKKYKTKIIVIKDTPVFLRLSERFFRLIILSFLIFLFNNLVYKRYPKIVHRVLVDRSFKSVYR